MKYNQFIPTLVFLLVANILTAYGQTLAITEHGDSIYVYDNGTWSFELLEEMPNTESDLAFLSSELSIDTLSKEYKYTSKAKKQAKNARGQFTIKYDENTWKRVPPATLNGEAEFAFQSKTTDIWCVVISEITPIAADKLFRIAIKNMEESTGSTPEILKTEQRTVNGQQLIRGVLRANFSGIDLIFDTYYFSNDLGSVQFTTWTSATIWKSNESDILDFLNGFVVDK